MWTAKNRKRYDRSRLRYPSDLTDEEWALVAPLIPKDLPARRTLFDYLDLWSWDGTLERIHHALYVECREREEREASPTAAIIDSQSVKSAEKGGCASIRMATMPERRSRARNATFS